MTGGRTICLTHCQNHLLFSAVKSKQKDDDVNLGLLLQFECTLFSMYWLHVFICVPSGITPSHHTQENYYRKSWSLCRPDSFFLLLSTSQKKLNMWKIQFFFLSSLALVLEKHGTLIIMINPPFFLCVHVWLELLCCAPSCCVYKTNKNKMYWSSTVPRFDQWERCLYSWM